MPVIEAALFCDRWSHEREGFVTVHDIFPAAEIAGPPPFSIRFVLAVFVTGLTRDIHALHVEFHGPSGPVRMDGAVRRTVVMRKKSEPGGDRYNVLVTIGDFPLTGAGVYRAQFWFDDDPKVCHEASFEATRRAVVH